MLERRCLLAFLLIGAACGGGGDDDSAGDDGGAADDDAGGGDDSDGGDAVEPITPDGLNGLDLWLDGGDGVTGTGWADRSAAARDFTCSGDALATGTLGGQPSASFGGGTLCQLAADVPAFAEDEGILVAVAASITQGAGLLGIQGDADNDVRLLAGNNASGLIGPDLVSVSGVFDGGAPHVLLLARQAGVDSLRVDGGTPSQVGESTATAVGGDIAYVGFASYAGEIGEIVVYHGDFSAQQIAGIEAYLLQKYLP